MTKAATNAILVANGPSAPRWRSQKSCAFESKRNLEPAPVDPQNAVRGIVLRSKHGVTQSVLCRYDLTPLAAMSSPLTQLKAVNHRITLAIAHGAS